MSRSYREPWFSDGYGSRGRKRFFKNYANRRIRRTNKIIASHMAYKKFTDPWNICDYKFKYDPYPHIYSFMGELRVIPPEPRWKAVRK